MAEEATDRKCRCGFQFSGPEQFRNCQAVLTKDGWYNICPKCGAKHKSD